MGQGVITDKGVVGQIQKVGLRNSVVQLLQNRDSKIGGKIERVGQYGVLTGNYPGAALFEFITIDSNIKVGDRIVTSGVGLTLKDKTISPFPENFPIGEVVSVTRDPDVVDLLIQVKFYEDMSTARDVFVLK